MRDEFNINKLIIEKEPVNAEILINLLKPSIRIKTTVGTQSKTNFSKFGGVPDVPDNFRWPLSNDRPLSFFCQLNLRELIKFRHVSELPEKGMLYFFILTEDIGNRYPEKKQEYRVVYLDVETNNLSKFSLENSIDIKIFKEAKINFYSHYTFPLCEILGSDELDLDDIMDDLYEEVCEITGIDYCRIGHQISGHPHPVQDSVTLDWALKLTSIQYPFTNDEISKISSLEKKLNLLLQIDFDDLNLNFNEFFGDSVAYFGIDGDDLLKLNFEKAILKIQST